MIFATLCKPILTLKSIYMFSYILISIHGWEPVCRECESDYDRWEPGCGKP